VNKDYLKGYLLSSLDSFMAHDRDSFVEKMEGHLEDINLEASIETCLDELIEEDWIRYVEEGNNLYTVTPEDKKTQKTLDGV
jgi:hypothetical protein